MSMMMGRMTGGVYVVGIMQQQQLTNPSRSKVYWSSNRPFLYEQRIDFISFYTE